MMNMAKFLLVVLMLFAALPGAAKELVTTLPVGDAGGVLRIDAVPGMPTHLVAELQDPGITSPVWAIKGLLRHDAVEGEAYLQLDNHFGDRGTFFTRSLAPSGPLGKLSGTADWRPFTLPFYANRGDQAGTEAPLPEALTLNLYLPGAGTVYLQDLALYQYAADEDPLAARPGPGSRTAALIGAIGGSLVGVWGGLIGLLASRGKGRGFAIASANLLIVAGVLILAAGVIALVRSQPYAAWYPLVLFGVIVVVVVGNIRRILPRRYAAQELKKMQSMDA